MARSDFTSPTPSPTPFAPGNGTQAGRKFFTVTEAGRALPLVKRIAVDIQNSQAQRLDLNRRIQNKLGFSEVLTQTQKEQLQDELDKETDRLSALIDELAQIGAETKDPLGGLVDFPALFQGREVQLCWRVGENTIGFWHEVDSGFNSRRPIAELMAAATPENPL